MKHKTKFEELQYAKNAVQSCLKSEAVSVDFKGLSYWAGVVERLRKEIKESL
jgi:hypothetical protein